MFCGRFQHGDLEREARVLPRVPALAEAVNEMEVEIQVEVEIQEWNANIILTSRVFQ